MKLLVSGSTGLIGTELVPFLRKNGHKVVRLVRHQEEKDKDTIYWNPEAGELDLSSLEGFDGVIHLAGENIGGRWNEKKKRDIFNSRVQSTQLLAHALTKLQKRPRVFLAASAVGIYGDCGSSYCHEGSPPGHDFLADVCKQWEAASLPASQNGIRTVNLRFGIVLSSKGGALGKMLPAFKLGLGGVLGSGKQYMSWIAIDDVAAVILFALNEQSLKGPVNVVTPYPETNQTFTRLLGKVLHRPAFLKVPEFALRLVFGKEMTDEIFLSSTRVEPLRLTQAGYVFLFPDLEVAFRHLLNPSCDL